MRGKPRKSAYWDTWNASPDPNRRPCDSDGCRAAGEHRAPKSPTLDEYYWFCAEHITPYNKAWNFYDGWDEDRIETQVRQDTTWQRPTWPLGSNGASKSRAGKLKEGASRIRDGFGFFRDTKKEDNARRKKAKRRKTPLTDEERAWQVLNLSPPVNDEIVKARYRELVKRHHPDANGGDKEAEERLKSINQAYQTLRTAIGF